MVSKARDDLPEPDSPVNTTSLSRGFDSVTFFRLCSRAPRMVIWSLGNGCRLFLFSGYCKRRARYRDEPLVRAFDAALGHHRAAACVDHAAGRAQRLPDLRGGDEAELQVEAHRAHDARLKRTQRPAHG